MSAGRAFGAWCETMKVGPRPSFANSRDQAHRNAIPLGEHAACPMAKRRINYLTSLLLCQFSGGGLFAFRAPAVRPCFPVRSALSDPLGMFARPVVIAPAKSRYFMSWPRASAHATIAHSVPHVLNRRSPIEVCRRVVGLIVITMGAVQRWIWPRAIEGGANEIMGKAHNLPPIHTEFVTGVSSGGSRLQNPSQILPLPVRPASPHTTCVGNLIVGCFGDLSPLFNFHTGSLAYNFAKGNLP